MSQTRLTGDAWHKSHPPSTYANNGRPLGSKNYFGFDVKLFCRSVIEDPEYRQRIRQQAIAGTLPPPLEIALWTYAYGKPKDQTQVEAAEQTQSAVAAMSLEERAARAREIADRLDEIAKDRRELDADDAEKQHAEETIDAEWRDAETDGLGTS